MAAEPCLTVATYDDLDVDLGLIRSDFNPVLLSKPEATVLTQRLLAQYTQDPLFTSVMTFNRDSASFDFEEYVKSIRPEGPDDPETLTPQK